MDTCNIKDLRIRFSITRFVIRLRFTNLLQWFLRLHGNLNNRNNRNNKPQHHPLDNRNNHNSSRISNPDDRIITMEEIHFGIKIGHCHLVKATNLTDPPPSTNHLQ